MLIKKNIIENSNWMAYVKLNGDPTRKHTRNREKLCLTKVKQLFPLLTLILHSLSLLSQ